MKGSRGKPRLSHLDADGTAKMVDVSHKGETARSATARAVVTLPARAFSALDASENAKGDALSVARIAGIAAAKRAADWIPLCHPLLFDTVEMALVRRPKERVVEIRATVRGTAKTGYEMEAMVAVSGAALTLYDMCKGADKGIVVGPIELLAKSGGKSGDWVSPGAKRK